MLVMYLGPADSLEHVRAHLPQGWEVRLALDSAGVNQSIHDCDVVLDAYMRVRFTADTIAKARRLKLFVAATTGADHVDHAALAQRCIPLLTLRGQHTVLRNLTPAAEHSWLLLMACARHLNPAIQDVLAGEWNRYRFPGIMLRGKLLGIVGCGRIGSWMSRYATAFGMKCLGYDPYVSVWPEAIEQASLEAVLTQSDFVSLHVPLNAETRALVGRKEFELMKRGSILVNTSRGEVIDELALLSALVEGRLAAAGLDVLAGEPDVAEHPLVEYARTHDNLIITPHIGGFSPDALKCVLTFSCQRITDFFHEQA